MVAPTTIAWLGSTTVTRSVAVAAGCANARVAKAAARQRASRTIFTSFLLRYLTGVNEERSCPNRGQCVPQAVNVRGNQRSAGRSEPDIRTHYNSRMAGRECHHCKQWIEEGDAHDCWTTTEAALTEDLSEDLRDAWERLRESAASLGDQRIYASHNSIMFSRKSCYFFVRPKRNFLEICVFLGRGLKAPQVRRVDRASKTKVVHFIRITHRDEVEPPVTDWLREAYELSDAPASKAGAKQK